MQKLKIIIAIYLSFGAGSVFAQQSPEASKIKHYFCVELVNGVSDNLVRYGILTIGLSGKKNVQFIPLDEWMMQFTGRKPSKANPDTVDFMREYNISFKTIKNLWKLKYSEYPWRKKHEDHIPGWARKTLAPSNAQMEILKQYGIKKFIVEPIYGPNLIHLLQDMQNPDWVQNYKNAI